VGPALFIQKIQIALASCNKFEWGDINKIHGWEKHSKKPASKGRN
jgi:hypothetical protein